MTRKLRTILQGALLSLFCFLFLLPGPLQAATKKTLTRKDIIKLITKRNILSSLPYASYAVVSSKSSSSKSSKISELMTSGNPPKLSEIPSNPIDQLFWRPGVVSSIAEGSPTQMQCDEFHAGRDDGTSGGMGACEMASNVGYTFVDLFESQSSLCFMKGFPSNKNLKNDVVRVTKGRLPGGEIGKIFNPPNKISRVVKVKVSGVDPNQPDGPDFQELFLRISSSKENSSNKNLYEAKLWRCNEAGEVSGVNLISIASSGLTYKAEDMGLPSRGGGFHSSVTGHLQLSGNTFSWDPTRVRTVDKAFSDGSNRFKSYVEIGQDITTKSYDLFNGEAHKNFSISKFRATSAADAQFIEGAYKGLFGMGFGYSGATEFRDNYYASAPHNPLIQGLSSTDLSTDSFYSSIDEVSLDFSPYDCEATAEIELEIDLSTDVMKQLQQKCTVSFKDMHFCHEGPRDSSEPPRMVQIAEQNFNQVCGPPPPEH